MSEITKLYIKNMCCCSCIELVKQLLSTTDHPVISVLLGEVVIRGTVDTAGISSINKTLVSKGFSIANSLKDTTIIQIKAALFEYLNNVIEGNERKKLSAYITQQAGHSYHYLSRLFSDVEKVTIEKYFLLLKIEKAKELLLQDDFNVSDISYTLGYSSPQSFATQFKKITGKTPLMYKQEPIPARVHLNKLIG